MLEKCHFAGEWSCSFLCRCLVGEMDSSSDFCSLQGSLAGSWFCPKVAHRIVLRELELILNGAQFFGRYQLVLSKV